MVSFFGLKFGAEKKKEDESSPSQSPVRRFDPDALDDGQFVPKDLARSGTGYAAAIYSTTSRPSSAHANKFKPSKRKYSLNVPDTHTLASTSTPEIPRPSTSHATTFAFSASSAGWGNGSTPNLGGPPPILGASARRPSTSSVREKAWVNPLDVHFSRDSVRTSALPAPLSQGLSPSPLAKKEENPPPLPVAPSIPARNPMRFPPPSPPRSAKTSLENEPCANEEGPSVPAVDKRPVRRGSSPLRRDGSRFGRGASPFRRGTSPFSREQSPFRRDDSPLRQDSNRDTKTPEPSRSGLGESESSFGPSSLPSPPLSVVPSHDSTASSTPVNTIDEPMAQNLRGKPDSLAMNATRQQSLRVKVDGIERAGGPGSAPPGPRPGTAGGMESKRALSPAPFRLDAQTGPALKAVARSATFDAPSRSDPKLVAPRSATFDIAPRSTSPGPMGPRRTARNGPPAAAVGAVGRPPVRNGPPPAAVGAVGRPPQPKRGDVPPPRQQPPPQSQPRQPPPPQSQLPHRPRQQARPQMPPQQQPRPPMPPQQQQRSQMPPSQQQPQPRMPPQQQPRPQMPPSQQQPRPGMAPPQQQTRPGMPPQQQPRSQMPPQQQPRPGMAPPQQQTRPGMAPQQQPRSQMPPQQQPRPQPQPQRLPQPQPQQQPEPRSPVQAPPPIRTDFRDFFSRRESCDDSICSEDHPESPDSPMLPVSGPLSTPRLPPPLAKLQDLPKLQVEPETQASGPTADGGSAPTGGSTPKPSSDLAPQSAPLPTKAPPSPIRWPLGVSEESDSEYDTQYGEDDEDEDEEDEEEQKQQPAAPPPPAEIRWPLGGSVTDDSDEHTHDSEDDDSDEEFDMQPPRLNGARCESPLSGMPMLLARSDSPFGARPPFSPHPWTGSRPGTPVRRTETPVMPAASSGLRSGPATPSQLPRAPPQPGLRNPAIVGDDFGTGCI